MEAPSNPAFDLLDPYAQAAERQCRGFQWDPPGEKYLGTGSTVKCFQNIMTITVAYIYY